MIPKAKIPYFMTLLLIGMYANYLFRNKFLIIDFITCIGLSIVLILKPNAFCIFAKEDKYNFISALPWYSLILVIMPLGIMFANHTNIASVNFVTGASITMSMFLVSIIVDISRYS